jgi:hypothetical protein
MTVCYQICRCACEHLRVIEERPPADRALTLAEVTPSLYRILLPVERRFTERQFGRLSRGLGRGLYRGPLDTPRQVAQLAYTYGTRATTLIVAPFIVGGILLVFTANTPLVVIGSVALVVAVGMTAGLMWRANRINAYFRQDRP